MSPTLPELDRSATAPLTAQIADHFAAAIEQGQLRAGDRLPPIRELARRCAVTRATVQDAYRQLAERRLVEGTVGRGTVVCAGAVPMASRTAVGNGLPLSPFATAALLGLNPRTLQRRLASAGASFDEIREDVYRTAAMHYLCETQMPLGQVAAALGYSEQSAFTRACRRWFGATPSTVRATTGGR